MLFIFSLLGLFCLANAVVLGAPRPPYDSIVIGGGPAGLSALSGLARVRRHVLLVDSGEYRNGQTTHMHDVIGWDGIQPAYFRDEARRLLKHYKTIKMMNGTVIGMKRLPGTNTLFSVSVKIYGKVRQRPWEYTARKVVIATGLKDILPSTSGIAENWGRGIYSCPWCDGHEYADQPLGLLCPLDKVANYVRKVLTLDTDIVAFVNGTDNDEMRRLADQQFPQWEEYLKLHNVTIDNRTITFLERLKKGEEVDKNPHLPSVPKDDLFSVHFTEGEPVERVAFLSSFPSRQRSDIGEKAGVILTYEKLGVTNGGMLTNVPGIYAVGDANSDSSPNIPHAMYTGKKAAVAIHVALEIEKQAAELAEMARSPDIGRNA
ncbi:thioredoxin reductase [Fusarium acutatum]|uniref:Thioredoxin reductase n=1 Tax=Fusarium acutatum TaxID=78861 RepID=A0A8H4JGD3_9HYPO|nr:thioredoxin reductase [Fusarium acutatum]